MTILYKIKLVTVDVSKSIITVRLFPTNNPDASPLKRPIRIQPQRVQEISQITDHAEQLLAYRAEILKGDSGFQADWSAEIANKQAGIPQALIDRVGDEFPEVTQEELDLIHVKPESEPEPSEVIF